MPLTDEERRELVAWFMDVRLRGVHPDWIPVWCGANKDLRALLQYVKSDCCDWPTAAHMKEPEYDVVSTIYRTSYKNGLPVWEHMKKDVGCQ